MSLNNRFYMLSHFLGRVTYRSEADIKAYLQSLKVTDVIDSLVQGIALSLMALRKAFSPEREARLVYWHQAQEDNPWVGTNAFIEGHLCRVPFDWADVIDEIVIGPRVPAQQRPCIRQFFQTQAINCPVQDSSLT